MNDELRDFELKAPEPDPSDNGEESGGPRWPYVVGVIVVIVLVVAFLWFGRGEPEVPVETGAQPTTAQPAPAASEDQEPRLVIGDIPGLSDSDVWLRGLAQQISSHPQLAEWLVTDELIRTFVVVVDNIAEGVSPSKHVPFAKPRQGFAIKEEGGRFYVDPVSYRRYDTLVDILASLDTEGTAELYQAIRPLCQEAYQELGYPAQDFDDTLRRAIQRILATPVVDGPIELEEKVTAYQFEDPALEDLSPAARQLLRLGPTNLQRVQAKVREIARAIGVEP
jgi:hypothetical protein